MIQYKAINLSDYNLAEREELSAKLHIDKQMPHVLLATCNRTELYWGDGDIPLDTARHLMRVAAGLESALIGERAIQGQLKQAYEEAKDGRQLSAPLHKLFQVAIHVGKRVRTETQIASGAVSHSQVVAQMLIHSGIDLKNQLVGIIGVNQLTEDILKFLTSKGAVNFVLSNRNLAKAQAMANQYGGMAMRLDNLRELLRRSAVVISATSAPHAIIREQDVDLVQHPHMMFDLAFPRDIAPELSTLPDLDLYNLEHIEQFAQHNLQRRLGEEGKAEAIIEDELQNLMAWQQFRNEAHNSNKPSL